MREGCACPDCDNIACRHGGCQGRKPDAPKEEKHPVCGRAYCRHGFALGEFCASHDRWGGGFCPLDRLPS